MPHRSRSFFHRVGLQTLQHSGSTRHNSPHVELTSTLQVKIDGVTLQTRLQSLSELNPVYSNESAKECQAYADGKERICQSFEYARPGVGQRVTTREAPGR